MSLVTPTSFTNGMFQINNFLCINSTDTCKTLCSKNNITTGATVNKADN